MKTIIFLLCLVSGVVHAENAYTVDSAIYKIEIPSRDGSITGFGTGVLVGPGKILTNCHVLKLTDGWPVAVHRKTGNRYPVDSHTSFGKLDACVLSGRFTGRPVSLSIQYKPGDQVWLYGYPHGLSVVGQGNVIGLLNTDRGPAIKSSAFCNPGSSGGPLLNVKGEMIGLNAGHDASTTGSCLSIPSSVLMPYLGM